ncbi:hypothetical protein [uncultured Clostridium sp.]|uniref:hypothetical protein n=1 Tax=uncultured Clostridium sp. TaxID=59620 RepID=UPI00260F4EAC|nr:hypothetical protein [uncultured Clostridium sp.]
MKVDKEYICNLLNIKLRTLKTIEAENKLNERLEKKGYNFIKKIKEGRKVYYIIEQYDINKEVYSNMIKYVFNTDKKDEFTKYFCLRTNKDFILSKNELSNKANISRQTVTNWDNKLIDYNIISKDGYFYFYIDKENKTIQACTKEEYDNFWKNTAYIKAFRDLQFKYINGDIDLNQLTLASAEIGASIALVTNKYYYRIKKYKTNTKNKLYIDINNLIKKLYGTSKIELKFLLTN